MSEASRNVSRKGSSAPIKVSLLTLDCASVAQGAIALAAGWLTLYCFAIKEGKVACGRNSHLVCIQPPGACRRKSISDEHFALALRVWTGVGHQSFSMELF